MSEDDTKTTGVFSNKQIHTAIKSGHIVYHPFQEDHVRGSSIDVTLGHWFYRTERRASQGIYNPLDEHDVTRYFDGPHHAVEHKLWCEQNNRKLFKGIPENHPIIVLQPGERILAHTHEFIGIRPPGTSTMQARSTWGRNGLAVCLDAGWGDPGYINRWTLEVYNMNQHEGMVIPVGERIAQMVFYHTGDVSSEYSQNSGKYQEQSSNDLPSLIRNWSPTQMLPRAFKDVRKRPKDV